VRGHTGAAVIFHEQAAIAGIDELDVEALAGGVELGLFQAMGKGADRRPWPL